MPRQSIHLIRASQVKPFLETAKRLGVPVRSLAKETGMPYTPVAAGEGVIGEHAVWRFIERVAAHPGCTNYGYLTAVDHPVTRTGQLGGMDIALARSLRDILEDFVKDVVSESNNSDYRLVPTVDGLWFSRGLPFPGHGAGWMTDQYVLAFVIQIVRLCAPGDWLPTKMRIASIEKATELPPEWHAIEVKWGTERTGLFIPDTVLDLAPKAGKFSREQGAAKNRLLIEDLVDRQIWTGQIGLASAARELGMSPATLKRRLSAMGGCYTDILLKRRLRLAKQFLEDPGMAIGKIASVLGYSSTPSFTRAFRKATGRSPTSWQASILK